MLKQSRDEVGVMRKTDCITMLAECDAANTYAGQSSGERRNANQDAYGVHPVVGANPLPIGIFLEFSRTVRELEIEREVETLAASNSHLTESNARRVQCVAEHNEMIG